MQIAPYREQLAPSFTDKNVKSNMNCANYSVIVHQNTAILRLLIGVQSLQMLWMWWFGVVRFPQSRCGVFLFSTKSWGWGRSLHALGVIIYINCSVARDCKYCCGVWYIQPRKLGAGFSRIKTQACKVVHAMLFRPNFNFYKVSQKKRNYWNHSRLKFDAREVWQWVEL